MNRTRCAAVVDYNVLLCTQPRVHDGTGVCVYTLTFYHVCLLISHYFRPFSQCCTSDYSHNKVQALFEFSGVMLLDMSFCNIVCVNLWVWWIGLISDWFWNKHSDSRRILKPPVCPVINMVFNLISVFHFLCSLPGEVMYMSHVWGSSEPTPLVSPLRLLRLLHKETHPRARQNQETQFR